MEHLTEGMGQQEIKGSAGRAIALRRGGKAVASLVGMEYSPPSLPAERVFVGSNRVRFGLNLVVAAIRDYGLCAVDFYRQWQAMLSSLAGAFDSTLEEAAVVAAYYSPQTYAAQNLVGAIAEIVDRQFRGMSSSDVRKWAKKRRLPSDAIEALWRFVQENRGQSLAAQVANIIDTNQSQVETYFQIKALLDGLRTGWSGGESLDEVVEAINEGLSGIRGGKYQLSKEHLIRFEQLLRGAKVLGEGEGLFQSNRAVALLPVLIQKGEPFFREVGNKKVVNFLWNILFGGNDILPTMDTRMMEAFGLFHEMYPNERMAIREALFHDDIYPIWAQEAAAYFEEIRQELGNHGIHLTIPEIQAAIWQTIRGYVDTGLLERGKVPFTFAHLFPETTVALMQKLIRRTGRFQTNALNIPYTEEVWSLLQQYRTDPTPLTQKQLTALFLGLKETIQQEQERLRELSTTFSQLKRQKRISGREIDEFITYRSKAEWRLKQQVETLKDVFRRLDKTQQRELTHSIPSPPEPSIAVGIRALLNRVFGEGWKSWRNLEDEITRLTDMIMAKQNIREQEGFGWRLTEGENDVFAQFIAETTPESLPYKTEKTLRGQEAAEKLTASALPSETLPPLFGEEYQDALKGMQSILDWVIQQQPTKFRDDVQ